MLKMESLEANKILIQNITHLCQLSPFISQYLLFLFSWKKQKIFNFLGLSEAVHTLMMRAPNANMVLLRKAIVLDNPSRATIFSLALHNRLLLSAFANQRRLNKVSHNFVLWQTKLAEIALLTVSMIALWSLSHFVVWKKTTTKKLGSSFCFKLKKLLISFSIG